MLAVKIIVAIVAILAVAVRMVMDFLWRDKRTTNYRRARNIFIYAALAAAVGNLVVLFLDEVRRGKAAEIAERKRIEFENSSLGGISPQLWLFYYKSNKLVCPRPDKVFPGDDFGMQINTQIGIGPGPTFTLLIRNPNPFPIYDAEVTIIRETPNIDNSTSLIGKLQKDYKLPLIHAGKETVVSFDAPEDLFSKLVDFSVETRRGISTHVVAMTLVSNEWEYASSAMDWTRRKQIFSYKSEHFPLGTNGDIPVQIITRNFETNSLGKPR